MDENILDAEIKGKQNEFRPVAFLLEFLSFLLILIIGVFFDATWLIILPLVMAIIYLLFGWYLFKGADYSRIEILISTLVGSYFIYCCLAYLFTIQSWTNAKELAIAGILIGILIEVGLVYKYVRDQKKSLAYRFSLKLLSRVVLFQAMLIYIVA